MRHAECEGLDAQLGAAIHHALEPGDAALAAFQSEPFRRVELVREELLELVREAQSLIDVDSLFLI